VGPRRVAILIEQTMAPTRGLARRDFLTALAAAGVAGRAHAQAPAPPARRSGRIRQSLMRVNFGRDTTLSFDDMCRTAAELGCAGFDLVAPQDWPTLARHGLVCTMAPPQVVTIRDGLIRPELHDAIERTMHAQIDQCAASGCPNIITVGGERRGLGSDEGRDRAVALLNRVKAHAEDKGVTLCLEVVNSKYTDPEFGRADAIFDRLSWGADVCTRVASPRVKILFDIYHVQIMEGDVCANIRKYFPLIAHFHAAGVPGRHELDETQEINYRFVAQTIADLGFTGFIAHEWRPTAGRDPRENFRRVLEIMNV
jgi:hydroxypyruvate isomerase